MERYISANKAPIALRRCLSPPAVDGSLMAVYTFRMGTNISKEPLGIGDSVIGFELEDQEKNKHSMGDALSDGPLAIVFYRGDW